MDGPGRMRLDAWEAAKLFAMNSAPLLASSSNSAKLERVQSTAHYRGLANDITSRPVTGQ